MVQTPAKPLTLEAFLTRPETKPASEFVDGKVFQKPMPQGKHSALQADLMALINAAVRAPKIARAFPELRCTFGGSSIVPDIAVFVWARIQRDANGEIANTFPLTPDWTLEILSPGQSPTKVTKKIMRCLKHGSQMGWLSAPEDKAVWACRPQREIEIFDEPEDLLPTPDFADALTVTVADHFALLLL
ncbi:MAG: Uma2 family endonuclease [Phormidesmis sp.]